MTTDDRLPSHPEPPHNLAEQKLPVIERQHAWFRIHQNQYDPLYFGCSGNSRFDAPNDEYGILYIAQHSKGAFIETFGANTGIKIVSNDELSLRSISRLQAQRSLKLVDLTGPGLAIIGADARLCTGDHRLAQRWALAFWQNPQVDGIYYRARHDPEQYCAAIFDRTANSWQIDQTLRCASHEFRSTLAEILDCYKFGLIE
jgi:RES domain